MTIFSRPNLPYPNQSLPNDNRFQVLTQNLNAPPTDIMLDSEFNYVTDSLNALDAAIAAIEAGSLEGADNPNNANLLLTTNGAGNISWVRVTDSNCGSRSINGDKLIDFSVTERQLQNGTITYEKIAPKAIITSLVADGAIGTNQISANANIIGTQLAANADIVGTQLTNNTITATQIAPNTITATEIADNTITATQIANQTITATQIANNTITPTQLTTALYNMISPIGTVIMFAGTTGVPNGWIECNGQAINRQTYATLFTNLGTIYGNGDGFTTFNVPDFRGNVPVGIGSDNSTGGRITNATAPNINLGAGFGEERHQLTVAELASHTHSVNAGQTEVRGSYLATAAFSFGSSSTQSTGGDQPHNNTQPSIFTRYYIRAL